MNMTNISFKGKIGIITGGVQGIGYAIAKQFVALGGKAIIVDVNAEKIQTVAEEIGNAVGYVVDLGDADATAKIFEQIIEEQGRIDVLINNAGIVSTPRFEELTLAEWNRVIAIDLTSVFVASQIVFRHMTKTGGGRIVNLASVAGKVGGGYLGTSAYAAAKAGVLSLTKSIAKDGSDKNIYCNSVCPAYTCTPLQSVMTKEKEEKVLAAMQLHRGASADEVASTVIFLASEAASFIQGENINCDGGLLMDG